MNEYKTFPFHLTFLPNRTSFKSVYLSLDYFKKHKLFDILIKNEKFDVHYDQVIENVDSTNSSEIHLQCQFQESLNDEQKNAIINIVRAKNHPLPYLLFGPAGNTQESNLFRNQSNECFSLSIGTGKTRTLVACIEHIVRTTNKNIMVCAPSNAASDEIAIRLVKILKDGELFRLFPKLYEPKKIHDVLRKVCNLRDEKLSHPSLSFLYQFRVVVTTVSTVSSITRAREDPNFKSGHFAYVFIDEAACLHEPATMVAIAGLCSEESAIKSSIVLAGDPKQLDAVTMSSYAVQLGYKKSYMEYLFDQKLYQRSLKTGNFNPQFITQLVKNYRCHPKILEFSNKLFYENKLEAKAPSGK